MPERRYVKCMKCGDTIDKRDDFGWVKNDRSGRYICAACACGYINGGRVSTKKRTVRHNTSNTNSYSSSNTHSAKSYKIAGIIAKVIGIVVLLMSILLMFELPAIGIFFAVFSVLLLSMGRIYLKKAKEMTISQEAAKEIIEQK